MLLTNHVLTGTLLGLVIDNPALLAPTAVASHLVLDMTPHYGPSAAPRAPFAKRDPNFRDGLFLVTGSIDFALSVAVVIGACLIWPARTLNIIVGAIGAALPDLTYIPIIVFGQKLIYKIPGYQAMIVFLARIQWYEKPLGLITEAVWATLMLTLLARQLP